MGSFINKGNGSFTKYLNGEYVDKTEMISFINSTLNTADMLSCVTRPRRFGKSLTAYMLYAYYDKSCDSSLLFDSLNISKSETYHTYLNKYPSIFIDITDVLLTYQGRNDIVKCLQRDVKKDVLEKYPDVKVPRNADLMDTLFRVHTATNEKFVMVIDEWDALCREFADKPKLMDGYVSFLRKMFKTVDTPEVFAGVYMTGILPIKKYGTQSALNDFREYSMIEPGSLVPYIGFTDDEVQVLSKKYGMDIKELRDWYDGYDLSYMQLEQDADGNGVQIKKNVSIYNPHSVMQACQRGILQNYWSKTECFESLQQYIDMDFDGVQEKLEKLIKGQPVSINVLRYGNDLNAIGSDDELFTLLTHLGYLSYDVNTRTVTLPNQEIREEFTEALRGSRTHKNLYLMIKESDKLLQATLDMDEEYVADALQTIHRKETAVRFYNNEQALRNVVRFAYISAREDYIAIQELPGGDGFADIVYIPRRYSEKPILVVELKWNDSTESAIQQIKDKNYPEDIASLTGDLLLVGINYDKDTKEHTCTIERWEK